MTLNSEKQHWKNIIPLLIPLLGEPKEWLISGSTALAIHGTPLVPRDLDIWCRPSLLPQLAAQIGVPIVLQSYPSHSLSAFRLVVEGCDVEVVGSVTLPNGAVMQVDEEMLAAAGGSPLVESVEDLIAELLTLNRPAPKQDLNRALLLLGLHQQTFRPDRCKSRLIRFGLSMTEVQQSLYLLRNHIEMVYERNEKRF